MNLGSSISIEKIWRIRSKLFYDSRTL